MVREQGLEGFGLLCRADGTPDGEAVLEEVFRDPACDEAVPAGDEDFARGDRGHIFEVIDSVRWVK